MTSQVLYSFPILKFNDIVLCLNELGVTVTEEELSHPERSKEQIKRIYEFLTELCTGITRDELSQPAFVGLKRLTYPELHEESIPLMNSLRSVQRLMEICSINDFTLKDFMEPTARKLKKHLSGIINFVKFREERLTLLNDLVRQKESIVVNYNRSKGKNEELQHRLSVLQDQTREEAKLINEIDQECKTIESVITTLNQKQAEIREEIAEYKAKNIKLKDTYASKQIYLEELQQQKTKLQGQIVSSPKRFKKQIQDLSNTLATDQQSIRQQERKHREILSWTTYLDECLALMISAQDSLNEVQVEASKHRDTVNELHEIQHQMTIKSDHMKSVELNNTQLSRQLIRYEEKLTQLRAQGTDRASESKQLIEQLRAEMKKCERNQQDLNEKIQKQGNEINQLKKQKEVEKELQDQEIQDMIGTFKRTEKVVMNHLKSTHRALQISSD